MDCYHVEQRYPTRFNNILHLILNNQLKIKDDKQVLFPVDNSDYNVLRIIVVQSKRKLGYVVSKQII